MGVPPALLGLLERQPSHGLSTQRGSHLQRMRELTDVRRDGGTMDALPTDHGLFHLEADPRWIDTTETRHAALRELIRRP